MTTLSVATVEVPTPAYLETCRQRAAAVAKLAKLPRRLHTRFVTAVSELSRAMMVACIGGKVEFAVIGAAEFQVMVVNFTVQNAASENGATLLVDAIVVCGKLLERVEEKVVGRGVPYVQFRQTLPTPLTAEEIASWQGHLGGYEKKVEAARQSTRGIGTGRMAQALSAADAGVWSWQSSTGEVRLDEQATRLVNAAHGNISLEDLRDTIHPEDAEGVVEKIQGAAEGEDLHAAFRVLWSEGTTRHITLRGSRHGEEVIGLCQDITDEVVRNQNAQYRGRQRLEAIGELAGSMAHEINNLLQPIISLVQLVEDAVPPTSPIQEDLRLIHDCGRQAADIIKNVLMFARPTNDSSVRPSVPLESLLEDALRFIRPLLPPSIKLDYQPDEAFDGATKLDANDLRHILTNLVTNASHAMDSEGTIQISLRRIASDTAPRAQDVAPGEYAELVVVDTGCGMKEAVLPLIFEPFFTTSAVGHGTGLGLSVVLGIIRGCGGGIAVDSVPGGGTTFTIYLPVTGG